jgi:hypothetical protein
MLLKLSRAYLRASGITSVRSGQDDAPFVALNLLINALCTRHISSLSRA